MKRREKRGIAIFLMRNMVLYFLLYNAFLHVRDVLNLIFFSVVFIVALLISLWMEKSKLRVFPVILITAITPFFFRLVFFLVFWVEQSISPGVYTDFLNLFFDTNFYPTIIPFYIVCLFNFFALRSRKFIPLEVLLNSLILVVVFWSESNFKTTLYPHPVVVAILVTMFIVAELVILLLDNRGRFISVFSFLWIIVFISMILIIFLFGKYSEGAVKTGGGLMKPTFFRFDFSQYVKLESEIELSDDLVMLFRKEGPSQRILLRRFILSGYSEKRGFFVSREAPGLKNNVGENDIPTTVPDSPIKIKDPGYSDRVKVKQEFFFINFDPSSLIAMNYPVRVVPLTNWDSSSFLRIYRVISRVTTVLPLELDDVKRPKMSEKALEYYTNYGNDKLIRNLALKVTRGEITYYGKIKAIERYLKDNFFYSLKPGIAEDGNQLHHFLFVSKKGYCSYFAFAMALMCRSLGIPARVAVGFFVNPRMEVLNFYEIRANQAHAWVEVYFNRYGWIEFDPTSENIAPGENLQFGFNLDLPKLAKLIEEILNNQDKLKIQNLNTEKFSGNASRLGISIARGLKVVADIWYIVLPLLYLCYLVVVKLHCFLMLLVFRSLPKNARRRVRYLYCHLLVILYGLGYIKASNETRLEYARRLGDMGLKIDNFTSSYLKSVFDDVFEESDYYEALGEYKDAIGSIRKIIPWYRRVLGFLNPLHTLSKKIG